MPDPRTTNARRTTPGITTPRRAVWFGLLVGLIGSTPIEVQARRPDGQLELVVVDAESGEPIPARLHLSDARRRPIDPRKRGARWGDAALGDHAYLAEPTELGLKRGAYRFTLDAGPEYRTRHGHFEIARHAQDSKRVGMTRAVDLADEGWFAADWATQRPVKHHDLLKQAEQLMHLGTVHAEWTESGWRFRDHDGPNGVARWASERGVVWLIDPTGVRFRSALPQPTESSVEFLRAARRRGLRVAAAVASPELPLWIAADVVDAVVVIDGWLDSPAGAEASESLRPANTLRYPGAQGAGRWRRALYESLVEAGVALPPLGLSGSGLNETPAGDGRTYALVEDDAESPTAWWDAAEGLAVVATNGPLLRPFANGQSPGHAFVVPPSGELSLSIALSLTTRAKIDYLEVVRDGEVAHSIRLAELAAAGGRLPELRFDRAGWASIVAVTETEDRYELAMSAPWTVLDRTGEPRVSAKAARAWLEALDDARDRFGATDPTAYEAAERFWRLLASRGD